MEKNVEKLLFLAKEKGFETETKEENGQVIVISSKDLFSIRVTTDNVVPDLENWVNTFDAAKTAHSYNHEHGGDSISLSNIWFYLLNSIDDVNEIIDELKEVK